MKRHGLLTHHRGTDHPKPTTYKRLRQHPSPHNRPLAPKGKVSSEPPVQHTGLNNTQDQQPTEGPDPANDVKFQPRATSQSHIPLESGSSNHGFTSSSALWSDRTFSSLERKLDSAVAPYSNIYSNKMPSTPADDGFPEPASRNPFSGVAAGESHGFSTHHLQYDNLQVQQSIQNRHGEQYLTPTLNTPEDAVWIGITQPTMDVYEDQSSQPTSDQHPTQQPIYHAPLQQGSQHVACVNCPSIWCFHLESIMLSDPEDKGVCNLKRSYRDLRQHIHEAHQWHYGAACAMCENLFCYHLEIMMLLEVAKEDLSKVKIDLRSSFKALREHVQEAHGGC